MKSITTFLTEAIDTENLRYKIQTWYADDVEGKESFNNYINKCKEEHRVNPESFSSYYDEFESLNKTGVKAFVDFVNDNVGDGSMEYDYRDSFFNIIRAVAGV